MRKTFVGARLRRLREEQGLTQAELARRLEISPSYLNQIEHNQRPLTVPVLLKLNDLFDVEISFVSENTEARLIADLQEVFVDSDHDISNSEIRDLAATLPSVGKALVTIHRRHRAAVEQVEALSADTGSAVSAPTMSPAPYEEVRDFFYDRRNYIDQLDRAAERVAAAAHLEPGAMEQGLVELLAHVGIRVAVVNPGDQGTGERRRFDAQLKVLQISRRLDSGRRAFHLATQYAVVALDELIGSLVAESGLSGDAARLARIGLAHYFAGALLMPYQQFLTAAEEVAYDIDLLGDRFGVGFEKVCHRLSTLQRRGAKGVPFLFVRVDRAGNISKRQSATDFHFSRVGGGCPLWVVHDAFTTPDRIRTQVAQMPDGRTSLWVTRTVSEHTGGWADPPKSFAIALGCDLHQADRLVYSQGIAVNGPTAAVPIGPGCKVCERPACPQRAFPPIGRELVIDETRSTFEPYSVRG